MQAIDLNYLPTSTTEAMLLPLQTDNLLLPEMMVAEVYRVSTIAVPAVAPDWYIGSVQWRGQSLPLISFEALNGMMARSADSVEYVAVINSLADHGHLPCYAVALNGQPSIVEVRDDDLSFNEGRPRGRAEAMSISLSASDARYTAGIPNVEWVEQHLLAYTLHHR